MRSCPERPNRSVPAALWRRTAWPDLVLLGSLPVVAVAVFLLPASLRRAAALEWGSPTAWTVFASHFVHLSVDHLVGNLAGYAMVVPPAYAMAVLAGRRERFRVAFVGVLLGMPFALTVANLAFPREAVAVGSSGLVLGLYGLLPVALAEYLGASRTWDLAERALPVLFFVPIAVIALEALPPGPVAKALAAIALVLGAGYAAAVVRQVGLDGLSGNWLPARADFKGVAIVGGCLFVLFPVTAFSADVTLASGAVVNTYTHLVAYALGFLSAYLTVVLGPAGE